MHRVIDNPLYKRSLEESDPALWSPTDVEALVTPGPAPYHSPRGRVPAFPEHCPLEWWLEKLQVMNCHEDGQISMFSKIYELIEYTMQRVARDRQVSVVNDGSPEIEVNGGGFSIPFHLGCSVDDSPIFHLIDSFARYEERRQLVPDLEHVAQDEVSTDALDVAALIAQAANQKEWSSGPDGIYKAHVLYPTSNYKKLVLLTGWVPYKTVIALREGHEMLEPISLSREIIDVPCDPHCDWKKIPLFQIIAGLIDESVKLSAMRL
ncbi:hypothetical protein E4T56_gene11642 [Termitomyces sp. T112]|nr:hypothetical protein E4T56_gene11642 [Termitomyces sp. T112]